MNATRITYYAVLYASFLGALYSGARVLYVLFFLLLFLLFAALIMNVWSAFTFSYIQEISAESVIRDGTVQLHLEIHNERPIPYPLMRIRIRTPRPGKDWETTFNLPAKTHVRFDVPIPCPYRGVFRIGLSVLDIRDIFGLLSVPFRMNRLPYYREKTLVVYPRATQLPDRSIRPPDAKTYTRSSFAPADNEESFSHAREYRPGDRARQIHWKLSNRTGSLFTRQYDMAAEPSMLVLLDTRRGPYSDEGSLEWQDTACSCAATLIAHILQHRYRVTLTAMGHDRLQIRGDTMADYHLFSDMLAHLNFESTLELPDLLQQESLSVRSHGGIVLITWAEPDTQLLAALRPFQRSDADFSVIVAQPAHAGRLRKEPLQEADAATPDDSRPENPLADLDATRTKGPRILRAAYGDDLSLVLGDFL